ncbi:MAG TPA: threonine ammonia-lyase [Alphaproteobacteria bacterium]|nr:threonine ammonia-lyase [Alphaproteobacteria bacterium]
MTEKSAAMGVTFDDIEDAARALAGAVVATPTLPARRLDAMVGAPVTLKLECRQYTGSFKDRGALNKLRKLDAAARAKGVVACSAGNHAQGVAHHASRLGIRAIIVMPKATPFTKAEQTKRLGAEVVLQGDDLNQALDHADRLVRERGLTFIHPYDDPAIVAGQGTAALEMLRAAPELDCLVVPIGGGGLIAGSAIAAQALKPGIEIFGVESALYPSMRQAIAGETPHAGGSTIAEGIAVKRPGALTRPIIEERVKEILLVDEDALERAVLAMAEQEKLVVEGAGAAGLAALLAYPERFQGRRVGLIVSGGNIDSRVLASILMRGLAREGRLARLRIEISDAPGVLARVAGLIGRLGGNIVEVYHQRLYYDVPVTMTDLDVVVETRNQQHVDEILACLATEGFAARLLSATGKG